MILKSFFRLEVVRFYIDEMVEGKFEKRLCWLYLIFFVLKFEFVMKF